MNTEETNLAKEWEEEDRIYRWFKDVDINEERPDPDDYNLDWNTIVDKLSEIIAGLMEESGQELHRTEVGGEHLERMQNPDNWTCRMAKLHISMVEPDISFEVEVDGSSFIIHDIQFD